MTFWIAFKTNDAAIVVADSAVTSRGTVLPPVRARSSFGELQISDLKTGVSVAEEAVKIANLNGAVYVYAGDVKLGQSIGKALKTLLHANTPPRRAFDMALLSNAPFPTTKHVVASLTFWDDEGPTILKTNTSAPEVLSRERCTWAGPIPKLLGQQLSPAAQLIANMPVPRAVKIVLSTALFQSLSIHEYLIEKGIGGFYHGVYVDRDGITATPSVLYLMYDGTMNFSPKDTVAVYQYPSMLIVRKGDEGDSRIFVEDLFLEELLETTKQLTIEEYERPGNLDTDFVAFIRVDMRKIVVIPNKGQTSASEPTFSFPGTIRLDSSLKSVLFGPTHQEQKMELIYCQKVGSQFQLKLLNIPLASR